MIERQQFNAWITVICESHRHLLSPPTIAAYYDLLSPRMTTEQFVTMARRHLATPGAFFPKPGDLMPAIVDLKPASELEAQAKAEGLRSGVREPVLLPGSVRTGEMDNRGKLKGTKQIASKISDIVPSAMPKREGAA